MECIGGDQDQKCPATAIANTGITRGFLFSARYNMKPRASNKPRMAATTCAVAVSPRATVSKDHPSDATFFADPASHAPNQSPCTEPRTAPTPPGFHCSAARRRESSPEKSNTKSAQKSRPHCHKAAAIPTRCRHPARLRKRMKGNRSSSRTLPARCRISQGETLLGCPRRMRSRRQR